MDSVPVTSEGAPASHNESPALDGGVAARRPTYDALERPDGLAQRIRNHVLSQILDGDLTPGDKLPPERTLASQLGVSRTVVREALRSLASMNVLDIRQGAGVFVGVLDLPSLVEPLHFLVGIDPSAVEKLAEARLVLEPGLARLAAQRVEPTDVDILARIVAEAEASVTDPDRFMAADISLHTEIKRMSRNALLIRVMDSLEELARRGRSLTNPQLEMRQTAVVDLRRIAQAIQGQDADEAYRAMSDHLRHVQQILREHRIRPG